jgi:hypothetical protein
MAASRKDEPKRRRAPATTPEARENQMISLAVDLAERQLLEGTASSQVISHFLKLGSTRERLEKERLEKENELLTAKTDAIKSQKDQEKLYKNALNAMRSYSGRGGSDDDED